MSKHVYLTNPYADTENASAFKLITGKLKELAIWINKEYPLFWETYRDKWKHNILQEFKERVFIHYAAKTHTVVSPIRLPDTSDQLKDILDESINFYLSSVKQTIDHKFQYIEESDKNIYINQVSKWIKQGVNIPHVLEHIEAYTNRYLKVHYMDIILKTSVKMGIYLSEQDLQWGTDLLLKLALPQGKNMRGTRDFNTILKNVIQGTYAESITIRNLEKYNISVNKNISTTDPTWDLEICINNKKIKLEIKSYIIDWEYAQNKVNILPPGKTRIRENWDYLLVIPSTHTKPCAILSKETYMKCTSKKENTLEYIYCKTSDLIRLHSWNDCVQYLQNITK